MDEQMRGNGAILAALGLSEVAGVLLIAPRYSLWTTIGVAIAILVLFLLLFGGYFLYRRKMARKQRAMFSAAIEAQTTAAPKSVSDPNQRAALDKLRQKFQTGLQEYRTREKDIYDLPWYVIIGEPGSGKTEAIRHSGVDFPPGLQNELQGSGGTVNMDWWFTNHGIILDTAGRLLFDDAPAGQTPEWNEFLKLLKKTRPHCPINGLFIVLSVESLIKDSADKIAQKASRLAQQLDLIQRTLDVRFPVFLLVTKCDLLTGFRDFFESIDDPLLQHQMFGWSNPDPLDARFRPDLVDEHLKSVAQRLRRRRLALLRESLARRLEDSGKLFRPNFELGTSTARRVEDVEALFALPESIMRLAPRLRRYLETIFVAGEWSARPVFLRGIFFTSSMREGKALDEAIAFATGLPLDQLPEDPTWEKDRAFFLRDLFLEKVFRERGLVTRASNTLKLLRSRKLALFGSAAAAVLLFLGFAALGFSSLKKSVLREADSWSVGATNFNQGAWLHPIVTASPDNPLQFASAANTLVDGKQTLVQYQKTLKEVVERGLHVGWVFKPVSWLFPRGVHDRAFAQRAVFEAGVLNPLVQQTQAKMARPNAVPRDPAAVGRHRAALVALMQLEADGLVNGPGRGYLTDSRAAEGYLKAFLSYLTETDATVDTNLVDVLSWTYSKESRSHRAGWPPAHLLGGSSLAANKPLAVGLTNYYVAMLDAQTNINQQLVSLNSLASALRQFHGQEQTWLNTRPANCPLSDTLVAAKASVDAAFAQLARHREFAGAPLTNLTAQYGRLQSAASSSSVSALLGPVSTIVNRLPASSRAGLFLAIQETLDSFMSRAASTAKTSYVAYSSILPALERDQLTLVKTNPPLRAGDARWALYADACALAAAPLNLTTNDIGSKWSRFGEWLDKSARFQTNVAIYQGPLSNQTAEICTQLGVSSEESKRTKLVHDYLSVVGPLLTQLTNGVWDIQYVANAQSLFTNVEEDLGHAQPLRQDASQLNVLRQTLARSKASVLVAVDDYVRAQVGFPILEKSPRTLDGAGVVGSRQLLLDLRNYFTNAVWEVAELPKLRGRLDSYTRVANALVDKDGSVVQAEIRIPDWRELMEDRPVVSALRYVQVADGPAISEDDLAAPKRAFLARVSADHPLRLAFGHGKGEVLQQVTLPSWWLLQQVRDGRADALADGPNKWHVRIPIEDTSRNLKGNAHFIVSLPSGTPFPKPDEWPK